MKKLISTVIALTLIAAFSVDAKPLTEEAHMNKYLDNLETSIKMDNNGVQFWSLFLLARVKSESPERDLSRFNKQLNRLIDREESELVRVNAKMTYLYINSDELAEKVQITDIENPLPFYTNLYIEKYKMKFDITDADIAEQVEKMKNQFASLEL